MLSITVAGFYSQLVKAVLPQILHNDISSSQIYVCVMLHSTVLAIRHAVLFFRIRVAMRASPSNKLRLKVHLFDYWLDVVLHILDKI